MKTIPLRAAERAHSHHVVGLAKFEGTRCLISTYSVGSHGYAQVGWREPGGAKSDATTAHRAAWTFVHGQIPEGMTVDHRCKSKRCVNVKHLRLLANYENARRTGGRDWPLGQCVNGHDDEHLFVEYNGRRRCRLCKNEHQRAYMARRREAA